MAEHKIKHVTVVKDDVGKVFKALNDLIGKQVLVGIPDNGRNNRDDTPENNATIGYVMETGSPANNVPARPFLVPGVQGAVKPTLEQMRIAATAACEGNAAKATSALHRAGIIASNSVKRQIASNIPPPLKPGTIRGRKYARGTAARRGSELEYLAAVKDGVPPAAAQSAAGIVALINSGQLRNSITYVVRDSGKGGKLKAEDIGIPSAADVKAQAQ